MKNSILLAFAFILALVSSASAELCSKHKGKPFITSAGECRECKGFTSSGAFKLCKKCSAKLAQCEACSGDLKADVKPSEPEKKEGIEKGKPAVHRAPNGKEFPAHWGPPPLRQTRDLRPLPGGYGEGSGTLANWIQMNLDKDAAKPGEKKDASQPAPKEVGKKEFPAHWGPPPRIQTRDLRPLPGGYGQGSGTLARWIQMNLDKDAAKDGEKKDAPKPAPKKVGKKEFPAHWGPPPQAQTFDLRPLPGGYGEGSGTLANWIQKNLDADAKDPNRGKGGAADNSDLGKVKAALEAWAKTREACQGNYSYTASFQSAFGFGYTTTIVVAGNKVVERRYEEFNRQAPPRPGAANPNDYLEKGADVGKNSKGAPALTLDQVYTSATKIASQQLAEHESRYVRVNKDGLLLSCFTIDRRIADDSPRNGVNINTISIASASKEKEGEKPTIYRAPNKKEFPAHWGQPPQIQTRDLRPLPGGYGSGSGTLAKWIQMNLDKDAAKAGEKKDLPKPAPKE